MHEICALRPLLNRLRPACAHTSFDRSAILVKTMTVLLVVALEWPPMLLAQYTVLVGPAHLLGLLCDSGVN